MIKQSSSVLIPPHTSSSSSSSGPDEPVDDEDDVASIANTETTETTLVGKNDSELLEEVKIKTYFFLMNENKKNSSENI